MPSSAPGGYRIADELETSTRQAKPPWPPTAFFFLTVLFGPLGGLMFGLNWARLGFPEKRLIAIGAGLLPLFFAAVLPMLLPLVGFSYSSATFRTPLSILGFIIAYWQLFGQRPLYDAHIARGGKSANGWMPWVMVVVVFALMIGIGILRAMYGGGR